MSFASTLTLSALLTTVAFLGLVPTAAAEDCGASCIENCVVGVGGRITAQCEVAHSPVGADGCLSITHCQWLAACSALGGSGTPYCNVYVQPPTEHCVSSPPGGSGYGVCASLTNEQCMVWMYTDFWYQCVLTKIVN